MSNKKMYRVLDRIEFNINKYAGKKVRDQIFEDKKSEEISAYSKVRKARWVKGAIDRLDELVDERTRIELMGDCGAMCASIAGKRWIEEAKERRGRYETVDEFLSAEVRSGGVEREGNTLYTSYQPQKVGKRCFCTLVNGLPEGETMSRTYCYCSAGHVKAYWEEVLKKPIKVELIQSAITGAKECKFAIHL